MTHEKISVQNGGLNSLLIGSLTDQAWRFGSFADFMQNHLFETNYTTSGVPGPTVAVDLLATNINRGRDHGIPSYATFLKL